MKHCIPVIIILMMVALHLEAQTITLPPSGNNQQQTVIQQIGLATVSIQYSGPDVHGPNGEDRRGHIWGELVHFGFVDQGFGTSKSAPWRAGANENTIVTFSHDVLIEGHPLAAGKYGLFLDVAGQGPWTWIFSRNTSSWGSYFYSPEEDALRVSVDSHEAPYTEWLTYGFDERSNQGALAYLQWENKRVTFRIQMPDMNAWYIANLRNELRGSAGFDHSNWVAAANFCAQQKMNLEEALTWIDKALTDPFFGKEDFEAYQVQAALYTALNRAADAERVMARAIRLPGTPVQQIHQYGRALLAEGKHQQALDVFLYNRQAHPDDKFTTYVGLARGYTAVGDKKNAIKHWEIAIKNLPANQQQNKALYEAELRKLKG